MSCDGISPTSTHHCRSFLLRSGLSSGQPAMVLLMMAGATCAVTFVGVPWYFGLFRSIQFTETKMEAAVFVFVTHVGPYKHVGNIFAKLAPLLPKLPAGVQTAFIGLDSPQHVEASKLRSLCGLWLPVRLRSDVDGILQAISAGAGLKMSVREINAARAQHTFFPLRNQLSYMLGPMKVYSAAFTGLDAPPCGCVELYHSDQIEYIFALENPEDYKWPDA